MQNFRRLFHAFVLILAISPFGPVRGDDLQSCRDLWLHGQYEECITFASKQLEQGTLEPGRFVELRARSQAALGKYAEACESLRDAIQSRPWDIQLRWLLIELAPYADLLDLQKQQQREFEVVVGGSTGRFMRDSDNVLTLARFVLHQGADPKQVREVMIKRAQELDPTRPEPSLLFGQLALEKRDFATAADAFRQARTLAPEHPDVLYGLALSMRESDPEQTRDLLEQTLRLNQRHAGALQTLAEIQINAEEYPTALELLQRILKTNPHQPEALALQAAIFWIQGEDAQAEESREKALSSWKTNPKVDFLIGRTLSQKYRFAEGAEAQRRAIAFDPRYLPARKQLALDLLRLGQEDEGWRLVKSVYHQDQYDVTSYNLVTLRDELDQFTTFELDGLQVRMEKREAELYGNRVLKLLTEARQQLARKYEVQLPETILVEIYPDPADFAVRTFGLPGAGGYLGVCFGNVVTARSPASQSNLPNNWESVLWHEFAHVITLNKTRNRMPRWLSEGISVYEEQERDPLCGEQLTLAYCRMILEGDLTPISKLSGAFLSPKSPQHLMFAYFESGCVIRHLVEQYGHQTLLAILDDLALGMEINTAIERHTVPMQQLEEEFEKSMLQQARNYRGDVDWEPVDFSKILDAPDAVEKLIDWANAHPRNYPGLKTCAVLLNKLERPEEAVRILTRAVEVFPRETGANSGWALMAELHHRLGNRDEEKRAHQQLAAIDDDAASSFLRLIELEAEDENWDAVRTYSERLIAVNPLIAAPYAGLARAAEQFGNPSLAVEVLQVLLKLKPVDRAGTHFRLATQLLKLNEHSVAREHLLEALELAPRYREALQMLVDLQEQSSLPPP